MSRVSKLRDMFQKGVIIPIDESDLSEDIGITATALSDNSIRAFPGSPPLSALRTYRFPNAGVQNGNIRYPKPQNLLTTPHRFAHQPVRMVCRLATPPARPPKPRNLLNRISGASNNSAKSPTPLSTVNDDAGGPASADSLTQVSPVSPSTHRPSAVLNGCSSHTKPTSSCSETTVPPTASKTDAVACPLRSSSPFNCQSNGLPESGDVASESHDESKTDPISSSPVCTEQAQISVVIDDEAAVTDISESSTNLIPTSPANRLTSWQPNTALNQASQASEVIDSSEIHDFIVGPTAFQVSPQPRVADKSEGDVVDVPAQHFLVEDVTLPMADDDAEEEQFEVPASEGHESLFDDSVTAYSSTVLDPTLKYPLTANFTLTVPSWLNVVAVDGNGVHILEDGNFLFTTKGLQDPDNSPEESTFSVDGDPDSDVERPPSPQVNTSSFSEPSACLSLSNCSGRMEKQSRVRFSTDPMMVFSTHSASDYNRRNDEIDPLHASVEYEWEKQMEEMDFFEVDLEKGSSGLGINILGLGCDGYNGQDLLDIFIKSVTPGGPADVDGQINMHDQIVEVNGQSLVGVTQQHASSILYNTQSHVHFLMARYRDPVNNRFAHALAEQEAEQNEANERSESESELSDKVEDEVDGAKLPTMSNGDTSLGGHQPPSPPGPDVVSPSDSTTSSPQTASNHRLLPHHPADSPRSSALKGAATAASTMRRQAAIDQLVHLAAIQAAAGKTSEATALASELYDCHAQINKLRQQVLTLEQQLTAQEAAADETIERLCIQCRRLEKELIEQQQFRDCESSEKLNSPVNNCGGQVSKPSLLTNGLISPSSPADTVVNYPAPVQPVATAPSSFSPFPELVASCHNQTPLTGPLSSQPPPLLLGASRVRLPHRRPPSRVVVNSPPFIYSPEVERCWNPSSFASPFSSHTLQFDVATSPEASSPSVSLPTPPLASPTAAIHQPSPPSSTLMASIASRGIALPGLVAGSLRKSPAMGCSSSKTSV